MLGPIHSPLHMTTTSCSIIPILEELVVVKQLLSLTTKFQSNRPLTYLAELLSSDTSTSVTIAIVHDSIEGLVGPLYNAKEN